MNHAAQSLHRTSACSNRARCPRSYNFTFFVCLLQILQWRLGPPCLQFPLLQPIVPQFVHLIWVPPVRPQAGQGFDEDQEPIAILLETDVPLL
jgi:hypothetical protein